MNKHDQRQQVIEWLLEPDNNFCAMPYRHVAIEGNGDVLPCCMGSVLTDSNGTALNITGKTLNQVINSDERKEMQAAFDANQQFPNCKECWNNRTSSSPRVKFSTNIETIHYTYKIMNGEKPQPDMTWLEIKPGNRCNLKCRICGVHNSSSWALDHHNMNYPDQEYRGSKTHQLMKSMEWIDQNDVWENVDGLENVTCIHMMGGEPFMIPEHFDFLEKFDQKYGISKLRLWYNTNGTINIPEKYLKLLLDCRLLQLSVSIDDCGERFNYQRKNADWDKTVKVLNHFFDLDRQHRNVVTVIDPTVSIYNILYLPEFISNLKKLNYKTHGNPLHFVDSVKSYHNVRSLTKKQKDAIYQHLKQSDYSTYKLVTNSIEFMYDQDLHSEEIEQERIHRITFLDKLRGERFDKVFPEMNQILGIYQ